MLDGISTNDMIGICTVAVLLVILLDVFFNWFTGGRGIAKVERQLSTIMQFMLKDYKERLEKQHPEVKNVVTNEAKISAPVAVANTETKSNGKKPLTEKQKANLARGRETRKMNLKAKKEKAAAAGAN